MRSWSPDVLVRRATRVPPAVRALLSPRLGHRALANAEQALENVHRAVEDRAALQEPGVRRVERLSHGDALELLARGRVGRFVYVAREGVPDVVPVNYVWRDGVVLIHSGPGPKLQAALRHDHVVLEVDEIDEPSRTGRSVVFAGRAEVVEPSEVTADVDVWAGGPRRHVIRIVPTRIDGRRLG